VTEHCEQSAHPGGQLKRQPSLMHKSSCGFLRKPAIVHSSSLYHIQYILTLAHARGKVSFERYITTSFPIFLPNVLRKVRFKEGLSTAPSSAYILLVTFAFMALVLGMAVAVSWHCDCLSVVT
jgi:hypothetical protein